MTAIPRSLFRLLLFVLPPVAGAAVVEFLMSDVDGGWAMRGLLPSAEGAEFVVFRVAPALVLGALVAYHLAVVVPVAWLTFGAGEGRTGARVTAAILVVGAATLVVASFLHTPGSAAWATLLMALAYGGVPATVLWLATSSLGPHAIAE